MEVLLGAVKSLSLARSMEDIVDIVRRAARRLSQADGATFVLRDGDQCHYVDEDAIGPLWRGRKFPMSSCISGWAMLNRRPAAIPDIYKDDRIPIDAYRPTFVRSLVMVPIRTEAPIGAIGTYWARRREISGEEVGLIQALADSTALAVEHVQFLGDLERRVKERTASLEGVNKELEAFSYSVSHDLRSPLAVIMGYSELMLDDPSVGLAERGKRMVMDIRTAAERMQGLIEDLLRLSRVTKREVEFEPLDLSAMAREILAGFAASEPDRKAVVRIAETPPSAGDPALMRIALENLLSNAWKYSSTRPEARIEFGAVRNADGSMSYFVRDNGVGFDMDKAGRLFEPFQRMHSAKDFKGTGIGLATVNRVLQKHGGRVWAESEKDRGSTFRFSLPPSHMALERTAVSASLAS
jgi:signal transduction histidine kinase